MFGCMQCIHVVLMVGTWVQILSSLNIDVGVINGKYL